MCHCAKKEYFAMLFTKLKLSYTYKRFIIKKAGIAFFYFKVILR